MKNIDMRNFRDLVSICILSAIDLLVYFVSGSNIFTDIISILFLAFIPGYLIVELVPSLSRYDQIERLLISLTISAIIGSISYFLMQALISPISLVVSSIGPIMVTLFLMMAVLHHRIYSEIVSKPSNWQAVMKNLRTEFHYMGVGKKVITLVSISIIVVVIIASLGMLSSVTKERYSEFYVLNDKGQAYYLPQNFTVGSPQQVILGVENHEGRTVKFFVELWLVNYTMNEGAVQVKHMYSVASMNITLDSIDVDINKPWVPQYEGLVPLNFTTPGGYYLYLMLFKDIPEPLPAEPFNKTADYAMDPDATWRVVEAVNNQIQYLRLGVNIYVPMI